MKKQMPIPVYMLFSYFAGVFATFDKTHWYMWLAPLLPLISLLGLLWIWNYEPVQKTLDKWSDENNG